VRESTLAGLLGARTRVLGPAPLLTYYSQEGDRVELSAATVANATAKTAGFLVTQTDIGPDDVVALRMPRHWSALPWLLACASIGATLDLAEPDLPYPDASAAVFADPERADRDSRADHVLVSSHPLGMPSPRPAPASWLDHAREAAAQPDIFTPIAPGDFTLRSGGELHDQAGLLEQAGALRSELSNGLTNPGRPLRFAFLGQPWQRTIWLGAIIMPLLGSDSSLWWARQDPRIASDERVDVVVDPGPMEPSAATEGQSSDTRSS